MAKRYNGHEMFRLTWFEMDLCRLALTIAADIGRDDLRPKYAALRDRHTEHIRKHQPKVIDAVMLHECAVEKTMAPSTNEDTNR